MPRVEPPPSAPPGKRPRSKLAGLLHALFFRAEHERERLLAAALAELERLLPAKLPPRGEPENEGQEASAALLAACATACGISAGYVFSRREQRLRLLASHPAPPRGIGKPEKVLFGPCEVLCAAAASWREPRPVAGLELPGEERAALARFAADWAIGGVDGEGRLAILLLFAGGAGQPGAQQLGAVQRDLLQRLADRLAAGLSQRHRAWLAAQRAEQKQAGWLKECPDCGACFDRAAFVCPHDDSDLEPTFLLERLLGGRYLLERRLGRGATGAVYAALDQETDRHVALKILAAGDALALGRFANEARAGRKLVHANLVQVLDSGTLSRQSAYLVMELLAGRTLRQILTEVGPLPPARVAAIFGPFLEGLAHAHDHGVVHRDLKPENIMVATGADGEEQVKILDFGLAKLLRAGSGPQPALTMAGMVIGTLSYMAPEQLAGEPVDPAADLFATGVMVAEALTGRLPFRGANLGMMLRAVATQPFELETRSAAQRRVAEILGRALEKKPGDRILDARTLRAELVPALIACEPFCEDACGETPAA